MIILKVLDGLLMERPKMHHSFSGLAAVRSECCVLGRHLVASTWVHTAPEIEVVQTELRVGRTYLAFALQDGDGR